MFTNLTFEISEVRTRILIRVRIWLTRMLLYLVIQHYFTIVKAVVRVRLEAYEMAFFEHTLHKTRWKWTTFLQFFILSPLITLPNSNHLNCLLLSFIQPVVVYVFHLFITFKISFDNGPNAKTDLGARLNRFVAKEVHFGHEFGLHVQKPRWRMPQSCFNKHIGLSFDQNKRLTLDYCSFYLSGSAASRLINCNYLRISRWPIAVFFKFGNF